VLTGDTLFIDGVGRPDLKATAEEARLRSKLLYHSLQALFQLNPGLCVLPAHTSTAVLFDEQMIMDSLTNLKQRLKLPQLPEDEFTEQTLARIPPTPPNYVSIAMINKTGRREEAEAAELEAGGNHCAIL